MFTQILTAIDVKFIHEQPIVSHLHSSTSILPVDITAMHKSPPSASISSHGEELRAGTVGYSRVSSLCAGCTTTRSPKRDTHTPCRNNGCVRYYQ